MNKRFNTKQVLELRMIIIWLPNGESASNTP